MKKLFMILCMAGMLTVNPLVAKSTVNIPSEITQITTISDQYDLVVLERFLQKIGFDIEKLNIVESSEEEDCTMTIKGTVDGKEVDLTITIKGQSCAEFVKELL